MIIVEGPDGSGKSSLIQSLGYTSIRLKSLRGGVGGVKQDGTGDGSAGWGGTDSALVAYRYLVLQHHHKQVPFDKFAFDRFHLSEVVYGPILRNYQELGSYGLYKLNEFLRDRHIPVILCLPPFAVTLANVTREGRERPAYQTEGFLHMAYKAFELLQPWATIVYDFTRDPIPTL